MIEPEIDYTTIENTTMIISKNKRKQYTVATVKNMFVIGDESLAELCQRLGLPLESVKQHADQGSWLELKESSVESKDKFISAVVESQARDELELELRLQRLKNFQLYKKIEFLERYAERWGDLYARHAETGDILYDKKGVPMELPMPTHKLALDERKGSNELIQGLIGIVNKATQSRPRTSRQSKSKDDILEIDAKQLLELTQENNKE